MRVWEGQERRIGGRRRHGLTIEHYHGHQSSFLITSHVSPTPFSSPWIPSSFLSKVTPSRSFLLLLVGPSRFVKLPGLFHSFLDFLQLLFFGAVSLLSCWFLFQLSVSYTPLCDIWAWRWHRNSLKNSVCFWGDFIIFRLILGDGCWKLGVLLHCYVIAWYLLTDNGMTWKFCWDLSVLREKFSQEKCFLVSWE